MKKYEGNSIRNVTTATGKLPDNVGFGSSKTGGGFIRRSQPKKTKCL